MVVEGSLSERPIYKILSRLVRNKVTGYLTVSSVSDTLVMTFIAGYLAQVESHYPRDGIRLGQLFIKRNLVTNEQLEKLLVRQSSELKKLGVLAREEGLININQLRDTLEDQMLLHLFQCIIWTKGSYHFRQEQTILLDHDSTRIDISGFLEKGESIIRSLDWLRHRIPSIAAVPIIIAEKTIAHDPAGKSSKKRLSSSQEEVYRRIDGARNVRDICDTCHQFEWTTLSSLIDLEELGLIRFEIPKDHRNASNPIRSTLVRHMTRISNYLTIPLIVLLSLIIVKMAQPRIFPELSPRMSLQEASMITRHKMHNIQFALATYELFNMKFPASVIELVDRGYLRERDLFDSWGYRFYYSPTKNGTTTEGFILISKGPDLQWATPDDIKIEGYPDNFADGCVFPIPTDTGI